MNALSPSSWQRLKVIAMQPNLETYLPYMDGLDLTLAQKKEIIRTVWSFMESQVDQAFGVHPVQDILDCREKNLSRRSKRRIESKNTRTKKRFNAVSKRSDTKKRKA